MNLDQYLAQTKKTDLIFDFDETLFRLVLPWNDALDNVCQHLTSLDESLFDAYCKGELTLSDTQNAYVAKFGKPLVNLFRENEKDFESNFLEQVEPNPELMNFIRQDNTRNHYLWTSNARETIEKIFGEYNLLSHFKKIITRDDVDFLKPDPEGFGLILDNEKTKSEYLMIGDSDSDELAASHAGIDFYAVTYFK